MHTNDKSGSALVNTLIVVAVLAIGGVVAYVVTDGFDSNDTTQTTNEKIDNEDENQQEQTSESDDQSALPSDFPETVPIYKPSSVSIVNTNPSAGQTTYVVAFSTDANYEDVVGFYEQELSSNGWEIAISNDGGRFAANNDGINVSVGVTEAGGGAIFTVTAPQQ